MQLKTKQPTKMNRYTHPNTQKHRKANKPGKFRLRGGELAAEDCLLEGIQGDRETVGPSYRGLDFGDVAPDVYLGDTAAE